MPSTHDMGQRFQGANPVAPLSLTVEIFTLGVVGLFLSGAAAAAEAVAGAMPARQFPVSQVFMFLFLMLGPFKLVAPFAQSTRGADPAFIRQVAIRAAAFASVALLIAAFLGEEVLRNYGIPLPFLGLAGGLIFFLVALRSILDQFTPQPQPQDAGASPQPSMRIAMTPLAFPAIVTPYGIAVLILLLALSESLEAKLTIGAVVVFIMLLNLLVMLVTRHIMPVLMVVLPILGAVIGIVQVALGLQIITNALRALEIL